MVDAGPPKPRRREGHELVNFYAALRELELHGRQKHARVAWLGDSHGAADLWSGPLRARLQERFGDAGPGFVHVGYKAYRHEGVHIEVKGRWAVLPRGPSSAIRTGDGVWGLGGVVLAGSSDDPHVTLTVTDSRIAAPGDAGAPPSLRWDLCYKLKEPKDAFKVDLAGQERRVEARDGDLGKLRHLSLTSSGPSPALRVMPLGGQPGLCGVTIETDARQSPGVVLDTLGINGARLITPFAWSEEEWVAELRMRPPDLLVVEYGTNEAGDHVIHPEAFAANLERLIQRVRRASPDADCLVLAPTDRADTEDRNEQVRDALRDAAKRSVCAFWDTYEAMGGKGSIVKWREETPPRAAHDGVHLTPRGYNELGEKLATFVTDGYRREYE